VRSVACGVKQKHVSCVDFNTLEVYSQCFAFYIGIGAVKTFMNMAFILIVVYLKITFKLRTDLQFLTGLCTKKQHPTPTALIF